MPQRVALISVLIAGLAGCTTDDEPLLADATLPLAVTVTAPINADGTFGTVGANPLEHTLTINRGDAINWTGLGTTDSLVQIAGVPAPNVDVCTDLSVRRAYNVTAPSAPNEFTGPTRQAASGLFALAPNGCGYYEIDTNVVATCTAPDVAMSTSGHYTLCSRRTCAAADKYKVMPETWANPDLAGVFLRIDWKDINPLPGVNGYDWTFLDREMNQAVSHGKVFTIGIRTADVMPAWIFDPVQTGAGLAAIPVELRDWTGGPNDKPPATCGTTHVVASPSDLNYRTHFIAMLRALAAHVALDSRWYHSLSGVKVSAFGLDTIENRMPHRCNIVDPLNNQLINPGNPYNGAGGYNYLYPDLAYAGGYVTMNPGADCRCNTKLLADAGYTSTELYAMYRYIEDALYDAFRYKPMQYMLIQDGFPKIGPTVPNQPTRYQGDALTYAPVPASVEGVDYPTGVEQTEAILKDGREGRWADPATGSVSWPYEAKDFVAQHSGLDQLPQDKGVPRACNQQRAIDTVGALATNPNFGSPQFPIPTGTTVSGDGGCPNKWAAKQGIAYQQLTGFQTVNNLETATAVDSALWNLTANTNATYLEAYEKPLWALSHDLGTGPLAAKLNPAPYFLGSGGTAKNLYEWSKVLHWRRAQIAPWFPTNVYMANPFPTTYKRSFTPAAPTTYYYINPRICQTLPYHYMKLVVN